MENKPVLKINVKCGEAYSVCGTSQSIVMIPFSGKAESVFFTGEIVGTGVDTQKTPKDGNTFLSARYMLEGEDFKGQKCRIFIENQGCDMNNCTPVIVTDSAALSYLETTPLRAVVTPCEGGVTVEIFEI